MSKLKIESEKLKKFCKEVFEKVGLSEENSLLLADSLVFADLRGVHSHGVTRLKPYVKRAKAGVTLTSTNIRIKKESISTALLDGGNGFGQVVGVKAMKIAIKKAKNSGIGYIGVKNSNHLGALAYYTIKATTDNMIGIVTSNAAPAVAPWGGTKALFGTNPISIGVPRRGNPLVLDMAFTKVARGKIRVLYKDGQKIPLGWALDENGNPTTDPAEALKGTLFPVGDFKGVNLIIIIDILCGLLTGAKANSEVKRVSDLSGPTGIGNNFIAIDISKFIQVNSFYKSMDNLERKIKNNPKLKNIKKLFIPGEPEELKYNLYSKEGIPLSPKVIKELQDLGDELGIKCSLN